MNSDPQLNDRGEPLLAADLVRNNIFQRADATISNEAFDTKRKEFEDQSVLMMTKDFVRKPLWNEVEIEARGKASAALARQIWSSPELDGE
jgi:hypothetical protein